MLEKGQSFCINCVHCFYSGFGGETNDSTSKQMLGETSQRENPCQRPTASENPHSSPESILCPAGAKVIILAMEICIYLVMSNELSCCAYHAHCAITVHNIHYSMA